MGGVVILRWVSSSMVVCVWGVVVLRGWLSSACGRLSSMGGLLSSACGRLSSVGGSSVGGSSSSIGGAWSSIDGESSSVDAGLSSSVGLRR